MPNALKQFVEKDIASFRERFNTSIVRLTILYSLTLAALLLVSGLFSYSLFSTRIGHRFRVVPPPVTTVIDLEDGDVTRAAPTPEQIRDDLMESFIIVNVSLFFLAAMLSYWLARKTLEPIRAAYEKQQRFLGDASHELRTPLAILQIDLENELHAAAPSGAAAGRIRSNLDEVRRMGALVNDILLLSRLDQSGHDSVRAPDLVPLGAFIADIVRRLQPLARERGVTLTFHDAAEPVSVIAEEGLLAQALTNVIRNALLYNNPDGLVDVHLSRKGAGTCVRVVDTGIGISAQDQGNVFDRFYRADKSRVRTVAGSGLGLSIAQSAVHLLKGNIAVSSEQGAGTTVTICFPR